MPNFDLGPHERKKLLEQVLSGTEEFYSNTKERRVSSEWDIGEVKAFARMFDFDQPNKKGKVIDQVLKGLDTYTVHTPHPSYFGLFNPRANFPSVLADLVTATYNPQLAAWSHSPFANEIENYVIQEFGKKFGYAEKSIDGTFCTGGAEANLTALICALNRDFEQYAEEGILGINQRPIIYCSDESHHSIEKAAKVTGLGSQSVRSIPVNHRQEMRTDLLLQQIFRDRKDGFYPLVIIGTAGTTGAGAIDSLTAIGKIAREKGLWFHVDAAYGGGAIASEKYRSCLAGIELSDSITLDLHKWFSVPMGASLFLTSTKDILHRSFSIKTNYMPADGDPNEIVDPYLHSIQWSRRFIGLKIYLPLAIYGWEGYEEVINHQFEMGEILSEKLQEAGWRIINDTPLPIICFSSDHLPSDGIEVLVEEANASGELWLSIYPINGNSTARLCITNYASGPKEIEGLVEKLNHFQVVVN